MAGYQAAAGVIGIVAMVVPHRRLSAFLLLLLALARLGLRRLALRGRKQRAKVQRGRGGGCCTVGAHCARGLLQAYHHPATSVFRDKTRRHTGKSQSTRPPNSTRSGQRPPATLPIAPPTRAETARHGSWAPWQLGAMAAGRHGSWAPWQLGAMVAGRHGSWAHRPLRAPGPRRARPRPASHWGPPVRNT
jgi:hypothetical protein